jgi:hypothetical protein
MHSYQPQIIWQGHIVGVYNNPMPDMAYLEGPWASNRTKAANAFETAAKNLNAREVMRDFDKGIKILLQVEKESTISAIVLCLSEDSDLCVRRITSS